MILVPGGSEASGFPVSWNWIWTEIPDNTVPIPTILLDVFSCASCLAIARLFSSVMLHSNYKKGGRYAEVRRANNCKRANFCSSLRLCTTFVTTRDTTIAIIALLKTEIVTVCAIRDHSSCCRFSSRFYFLVIVYPRVHCLGLDESALSS